MKFILSLFLALSVFSLIADDATYSYDEATQTYTVNVADGKQVEISADLAAALNANQVAEGQAITNFVKSGNGTLVVKVNLATYEGHVTIEDGVYIMQPPEAVNYTVGMPNTASVIVKDGATLEKWYTIAKTTLSRPIYFEGNGHYNGTKYLGALYCARSNGHDNDLATMGNTWVMTGDAMVRVAGENFQGLMTAATKFNMNSHQLFFEVESASRATAYAIYGNATYAANAGDIIVRGGGIDITGTYAWLNCGGETKDLVITNNSTIAFNGPYQGGSNPYTMNRRLVMCPGARIVLMDGANSTSRNRIHGPVVLADPLKRTVVQGGSGRMINMYGNVSGNGFYLNDNTSIRFYNSTQHTMTGGVVAVNGTIYIDNADAYVKNNGTIALTNATMSFNCGRTYDLPTITAYGACKFAGLHDNSGKLGTRDKRQYYPVLECAQGSTLQFYNGSVATNFAINVLKGLPEVLGLNDTYPSQCWLGTTWEVNTADVVAGKSFKLPQTPIAISSAMKLNLVGTTRPQGKKSFKILDSGTITYAGKDIVFTAASDGWALRKGDDGKSLYLDYTPPGLTIFVK